MTTISLALRNLLRNRRRSLATLMAMTIGLTAVLIFGGYRSDLKYMGQSGFVQGYGHLQIQRQDYFLDGSDDPTAYGIASYQRIIDVVKHDPVLSPMLTVVTPELNLGGIAGNFAAGVSRSVAAIGVVVDDTNRMHLWNDYGMTSYAHPLPLSGTGEDAVVIGQGVARRLGLCNALKVEHCRQAAVLPASDGKLAPDDIVALSALEKTNIPLSSDESRIEMLAPNAHGAPNVVNLDVVGAENMGLKTWDDTLVFMHLAQAQRLIYGDEPPQVTAIKVQLHHTSQMPLARKRLLQLLATDFKEESLEVLDFSQLNPSYGQTNQFMDSVFGFMAALIGVIVLFMIGNTMSAAVVERTIEIGTLRAMGLRRSGIRRLFMCEGVLLGLSAAATGVLCALIAAYMINHSGLSWTPPNYVYAYLVEVRVWEDKLLLSGSVIGLIFVAILSVWWPANRASKLTIVDALRHV